MKCEIINIGTELLLGQIDNTNARAIAERLAAAGLECYGESVVGDNLDRIVEAIGAALNKADAIILTGGLGSTDDDLTRNAVAVATERKLKSEPRLEALINERLKSFEPAATEKAMRQAQVPEGAEYIKPTLGTAAGFILDYKGKIIAATPGVPAEMLRMLEASIIPRMTQAAGQVNAVIMSRVLKIYGLREVEVERMVQDLISGQNNPTIAPIIGKGAVLLRLTAKAPGRDAAEAMISTLETEIRKRLGDYVYAIDMEEMEDAVGSFLSGQGTTIALAESLTGGLAAARLINSPGSSAYVLGGVVAYSNEIKKKILGVSSQTILNHGAVSAQTAEEMASGVRAALGADVGLSSTGIAGPDGGTAEKPVGLVQFGLSAADALVREHHIFHGSRNEIRFKASQYMLNMLRLYLISKERRGSDTA